MTRPHLGMLVRRLQEGGAPEVSITPLIDVVFLLLIFFLCTLRFRATEGRLGLELPADHGGAQSIAALPDEPLRLLLQARAGEAATFPVVLQRRGAKSALGQVTGMAAAAADPRQFKLATEPPDLMQRFASWLRELRAADQPPRARIEVEGAVAHAAVVAVMNELVSAGFKDVTFAPARRGR